MYDLLRYFVSIALAVFSAFCLNACVHSTWEWYIMRNPGHRNYVEVIKERTIRGVPIFVKNQLRISLALGGVSALTGFISYILW